MFRFCHINILLTIFFLLRNEYTYKGVFFFGSDIQRGFNIKVYTILFKNYDTIFLIVLFIILFYYFKRIINKMLT